MLKQSEYKRCLMVLTGAFNFGGGIAAANRLAIHAFHDAGYHIDIVAFNEPIDSIEKYRQLDRIEYTTTHNNKLSFTLKVWSALLRKKYNLIFCDHVNLASMLAPLTWLRLGHYIVRLNGIEVFSPKLDFQGKIGLISATKRIAISEYTKREVLKQFPRVEVDVVDLALDHRTKVEDDLPTEVDLTPIRFTAVNGQSALLGSSVILHVGRMAADEQYKGQDVLICAMPYILEQYPDAQLVLVGKGDDLQRLINLAMVQSPLVQAHIFMPGFVEDEVLENLYQLCYVFAMPSRGEGFGLVYIEAMRWGKPCIASRIDAAQYIVQHEKTGLLVDDPTNSRDVASAILELLSNPALAEQYGAAGYLLARNYYQYEQFQTRFRQVLRRD